MSLQVWLPLTKDLRQQGLSSATIINNGASTNTAGKLGGCYSFNGSSNYLYTTGQGYFGNNYSFAAWVYTTSTSATQTIGCIRTAVGSGFSLFLIGGKLRIDPGGNNVQWTTSYTYPANTWFHLVVTYDGTTVKYYINGEYKQSYTTMISSTYWGNTLSFGASQANGSSYGNYLNGRLNDIRVYNHCLSPMEVKELAKGLVLHYPLNRQGWGQENLVWNSNWNVHSTTPPESWVNWGSPPTREIVTIDGKNWLHIISNTTQFQGYSQNWTKRNGVGELTANTKMTVSFTAKLATAASIAPIGIHWCNSSGTIVTQNWTTTALTTSPKRYSFTYTTPADCVAFNIMVGDNTNTAHEVWITDIKLEFGEIATPWCPNSSDVLATTMGLNSTTEYDCSGFCNNGTRTGTFTWTSDTPKYAVSTQFGSTSTKIQLPIMDFSGMANSYTFAWWQYNTSTGNMPWGFSNGNRLNVYHTSPLCWNTGDGSSNQFKNGSTTITPASVQNAWHHMVVTGDGTSTKLYIDGVYRGTATTYKALTGTQIWISGWDSGTSYTFNGSKECDFRIYATALSASDVKSLYQNCATIDPDGTIRGQIRS